MSQQASRVAELIEPSVTALGYELVGVEYLPQGKHSILRVYIDQADGIRVEDCQQVSRQISGVLDVEDPIAGQFSLEVSSPGTDRPLFKAEHYERFSGEKAEIRLRAPRQGQRKFTGRLAGVENDCVLLDMENGDQVDLPINDIERAHLKPEW
ncbi:ribosome maturation factor RimP [Sulfuriflexus sp.]|uniref:ribosome maturation factor RimP n=1 Tax=Sulfuriflexus sp. TaxID=2015443 RepID=UPI0028CCD32C|nr:ribosome maturation factor RimP [Sulfuriflexus sp.]MDT8403052.1 ribosome maturation factor RimP [Sulfuriflexus sp.]